MRAIRFPQRSILELVQLSVTCYAVLLFGCSTTQNLEYLGRPGPIPKTKHMLVRDYGVYTFASQTNFCRGEPWLVRGSKIPLWPDEPRPELVKRGTRIIVLSREHVDCGELDDRLSLVSGDLVSYHPAEGGSDRYAYERDVYSQQDYDAYAKVQRIVTARERSAQANARVKHIAPFPVPAPILERGYEAALDDYISHGGPNPNAYRMSCSPQLAQSYVVAGKAAFADKHYDLARRVAFGAIANTDHCHSSDHVEVIRGDAFLIMSKSELRLGMLSAGKNEGDAAAGSFVECSDTDSGYSEETAQYCRQRREEAHDIAQNG